MITGAAPMSAKTLDYLKAVLCAPIINGYGQTESTAGSFFTDYSDTNSGYVGGASALNEFKLEDIPEMDYLSTDKDSNGNPMPRGEVCLRGPGVFVGYFG